MDKLISANNLINCLRIMSTKNDSTVWEQCIEIVNSLPDEQKHGYWVEHKCAEEFRGALISNYECSNCHWFVRFSSYYCPYCGAENRRGDVNE